MPLAVDWSCGWSARIRNNQRHPITNCAVGAGRTTRIVKCSFRRSQALTVGGRERHYPCFWTDASKPLERRPENSCEHISVSRFVKRTLGCRCTVISRSLTVDLSK